MVSSMDWPCKATADADEVEGESAIAAAGVGEAPTGSTTPPLISVMATSLGSPLDLARSETCLENVL